MLDIPGLPLPEPVTWYVRLANGVLSRIVAHGGQEPVLPDGAELLTREAYEEERGEQQDRHEARIAGMLAEEKEQRRRRYEELVQVPGISEETARALTRHGGPLDPEVN
jgi:hypothetical protein